MKKMRKVIISTSFLLLMACSSAVTVDTSSITRETRAEWRELLKWPQTCDDGVSHITKVSNEFVGVDVYDWSIGRKLVSVTCETGAYNQGEMLFLETAKGSDRFNLLIFPQFKAIKDAPEALKLSNKEQALYYQYKHSLLWGNLKVNKSNGNIRNDNFYRGGGGCGVSSTYVLLNDMPKVVSLSIQETCEEKNMPILKWKVYGQTEYSTWPVLK